MKRLIVLLFLPIIIALFGCNEESGLFSETGSVVFYSDAHALLNCGPFDMDIFLNDNKIGSLSDSYDGSDDPPCKNSSSTVKHKLKIGDYEYRATIDCNDNGEWNGIFTIGADSCTQVFIDAQDINYYENN